MTKEGADRAANASTQLIHSLLLLEAQTLAICWICWRAEYSAVRRGCVFLPGLSAYLKVETGGFEVGLGFRTWEPGSRCVGLAC